MWRRRAAREWKVVEQEGNEQGIDSVAIVGQVGQYASSIAVDSAGAAYSSTVPIYG